MSDALWGRRPHRHRAPGRRRWAGGKPTIRAELTAARRQLPSALRDVGRPAGIEEGAIERLLLAFEELVSNGLRHGRAPVQATVTADGTYWLLEVSDTAADRPPTPAVDRDAAQGGLGLYLVARIGGAHGWFTDDGRKITWARVDHSRAEAPHNVGQASPGAHGEHPHRGHGH